MKTIKVIDLLNKIANGEEVPKKIKYEGIEYTHIDNYCYVDKNSRLLSYEIYAEQHRLNDEIEIIEDYKKLYDEIIKEYGTASMEDKKIKRVDRELDNDGYLSKKLNEIIDVVNQLKEQPPIININSSQPPIMQGPYKITCNMESKGEDNVKN